MVFKKSERHTVCYYSCQKFDISKDARRIFRHIPELFKLRWAFFFKCQAGPLRKMGRFGVGLFVCLLVLKS